MLWVARVLWFVLPVTSGAALDDALSDWSGATATTAAVLLWAGWAVGLLALLAPRPWGFTALRVGATGAIASSFVAATHAGALDAALAIVGSIAAAVAVMSAPVATASAGAVAYGDESRFPLRAPFVGLVGFLPVVALVAVAGIASGPILLADGRAVAGALALVVGAPAAAWAVRSLHALARRWVVIVPTGVVVVDPLMLVEPVRIPIGDLAHVRRADVRAPEDALDLRLGTAPGSIVLAMRSPVPFVVRRSRREAETVATTEVLVTPLRPQEFADALARRHPA